jgi:hypothetical protein
MTQIIYVHMCIIPLWANRELEPSVKKLQEEEREWSCEYTCQKPDSLAHVQVFRSSADRQRRRSPTPVQKAVAQRVSMGESRWIPLVPLKPLYVQLESTHGSAPLTTPGWCGKLGVVEIMCKTWNARACCMSIHSSPHCVLCLSYVKALTKFHL